MTVYPGQTIGMLGSGQLGRMFALAARQLGYRIHVFSPDAGSPTGELADREFCAAYDDLDAVTAFAHTVDVITYEFENVPVETARACRAVVPVYPHERALTVAQNRIVEKRTLAAAGLPVTPFYAISSEQDLVAAVATIGTPAVLKTARGGYDGKGQIVVESAAALEQAWRQLRSVDCVLEQQIDFTCEISVVGARSQTGQITTYGAIQNEHVNGILDVSIAPAAVSEQTAREAVMATERVLQLLDVVGVLCVEYFVLHDGRVMINEIAPRPHNSGHLTIEATSCSQFEQQLRAVCGLPLGPTRLLRSACMVNLLGDLWQDREPNWAAALALPHVHLHLYAKKAARGGRKMGHITVTADATAVARQIALAARRRLTDGAEELRRDGAATVVGIDSAGT